MELEHFSHEHPLILNEEHKDEFEEHRCFGCYQPISGPCYSCSRRQCQFFLHKLCAQLPQQQMQHPLHPQHPLTLHVNPPYPGSNCTCDACGEGWKYFTYHCSMCGFFDLDILCAMMAQTIEHKGHKHPLVPLQTHDMFICHACREGDKGTSYLCTTCRFWIHQKCASVPGTIQLSSHRHPLTLSYSLPPECFHFKSYCDLCAKKLIQHEWVYFCGDCRYLVHLNCATRKMETLRDHKPEIEAEVIKPNLIQLPLMDESIDLRNEFIKNISSGKNEIAPKLNHRSHRHRLTPLVVPTKDESDSSCLQSVLKDVICRGCMEPVSNPFYGCRKCSFFLHKWCAELPDELPRHPCHPEHPLVCDNKVQEVYGMLRCNGCSGFCTGFTFSCAQCHFNLDVGCASLPGSIRHEAHAQHPLILRENLEGLCTACHRDLHDFIYTCETCNFKLHVDCAVLPRNKATKPRRYDEHPFCLNYSPIKGIREYICEICEEDVNPKCWFYHCLECDRSTHTTCLVPINYVSPNFRKGDTCKYEFHRHPLKIFETTENCDALCDCCGKGLGDPLAFQCYRCSLRLHRECADLPTMVENECDKQFLILTCIPTKDHSHEYYCQICKLEIDRKLFYHCGDCNHSAHATCIPHIKFQASAPEVET